MANRTFLIESNHRELIQWDEEPIVALAASSNCIPVFWFSLFDENCIVTNKAPLQDGTFENYSCLVTSGSDARKRLFNRRLLLENLALPDSEIIAKKWFQFVNSISLDFIHVDTTELWMLLGQDNLKSYIRNCLCAYEVPSSKEINESRLWSEMLNAAGIDPLNVTDTKIAYKLAGYEWGVESLPWKP